MLDQRWLLAFAFLSACGPGKGGAPTDPARGLREEARRQAGELATAPAPGLPAVQLAEVASGTLGPYLAERGDDSLLLWSSASGEAGSAWWALPGGADAPIRVGDTPTDLRLVVLRARVGGGYRVVTTHGRDGAEAVQVFQLGAAGEPVGAPSSLTEAEGRLLWIDALEREGGALVFWAEQRGDRAAIRVQALGADGAPSGGPSTLLSDATAWQIRATKTGAALAVVRRVPGRAGGPLEVHLLGPTGAAARAPISLVRDATAEPDVDVSSRGGQLVVAWTDRRGPEPAVYTALVSDAGAVERAPARARSGVDGEGLVALAGGGTLPVYLAWERAGTGARQRSVELAVLGDDGRATPARAELAYVGSDLGSLELAASDEGVAALTVAPICDPAALTPEECRDAPAGFTVVRFAADLSLVASEPLRLQPLEGAVAPVAWSLRCGGGACRVIAAANSAPARVYDVTVGSQEATFAVAGRRLPDALRPQPVELRDVAVSKAVADVDAVADGEALLASWITYFDPGTPWVVPDKPAPDGRKAPVRAELRTVRLEAGAAAPPPTVISWRAHSLGGVALAAGGRGGEHLLGWAALDGPAPQVFSTVVSPKGAKVRQKMLTRTSTEVSDVGVARAGDGWIVAWVDERSGDPEVMAGRFDDQLARKGDEIRLTEAPGAANGLALLSAGDQVVAVWADARDLARPGFGDIFAARLDAATSKPLAPAARLASSVGHSHSPALARRGDEIVVAWIEEGADGEPMGARVALMDSAGAFLGPPEVIPSADAVPTALALDCPDRCRLVLAVDAGAEAALWAASWEPGVETRWQSLASLAGPSAQLVTPALAGDWVVYADLPEAEQGRVRAIRVDW